MYQHKVQYYETDKMGITHHSNYIRFMEEARAAFLEDMGWNYERMEAAGIFSPVTAVDCRYLAPSTFPDVICIEVTVVEFRGVRLRVRYDMRKQDGTLILQGHSEHCFVTAEGHLIRMKKEHPDFYADMMARVMPEETEEKTK